MWNNFCAVVLDLFWFALGYHPDNEIIVYGNYRNVVNPTLGLKATNFAEPFLLPRPTQPTLLPPLTAVMEETAHTTQKVSSDVSIQLPAILHAPVVMYVSAPAGSACLHSPLIDFDTVIETLPYGTAVTVIGYEGRFASVNRSNITGWVLKDDITPQKNEVWPSFVSGLVYEATHPDTINTRLLINDMFLAGTLALPLQAGEYITLRLKSEHRIIAWNRKRPRVAGAWAKLLRGTAGIHIGVTPKTDSIIEWQEEGDEGRLGFVEAVAPDLTITISAIGVGEAGRYSVKTMSEEVWRELRPVFIEVA